MTAIEQIRQRMIPICGLLAEKRITLSGTTNLKSWLESPERLGNVADFSAVTREDVRGYEIVSWNLFDANSHVYGMTPEISTVHFQLYFGDGGYRKNVSLTDPEIMRTLENPDNHFYRFLAGHQDLRNYSVHLGFSSSDCGRHPVDGHFIPNSASSVLGKSDIEKFVISTLIALKTHGQSAGFKGQHLFEPLDFHQDKVDGINVSAYARVTDPDFIAEASESTGFGFLVDIAHTLISASNLGYRSGEKYLSGYLNSQNIGRVHELHLTVPHRQGREFFDQHQSFASTVGTYEQDQVFALIKFVLDLRKHSGQQGPLILNFEHDPQDWAQDCLILGNFLAAEA